MQFGKKRHQNKTLSHPVILSHNVLFWCNLIPNRDRIQPVSLILTAKSTDQPIRHLPPQRNLSISAVMCPGLSAGAGSPGLGWTPVSHKYTQLYTNTHNYIHKYTQLYTNTHNYIQIHNYIHIYIAIIYTTTYKYIQIHTIIHKCSQLYTHIYFGKWNKTRSVVKWTS